MAAMAASLMWRGVGKCGSPAPKFTRFAPLGRSLGASGGTAMVAETSIRPMRAANTCEAAATLVIIPSIFADFGRRRNPFAPRSPNQKRRGQVVGGLVPPQSCDLVPAAVKMTPALEP